MTKAALAREMQRILGLPVGTVLEGDDVAIANALLDEHPNRDAKAGSGVRSWVVRANVFGKGGELHIIRVDGSEIDFSYRRALAPRTPAAERADLFAALRQEIIEQTVQFKRDRMAHRAFCAISAVPLSTETAHVDHVPPWTFATLADAWLADRPSPDLNHGVNGKGRRLADRQLAADWQRFHRWSARLRLIHHDIHAAITTARSRTA